MTQQRPNVLYLFTDEQRADAMSCTGNPDVRTPALDGLAAGGMRFENAYCTHPLCTPSRASMFTGRMPHEVKATRNNVNIAEAFREQELGRVLAAAGYECAYGGKWHIPELAVPEGHGFRRICGLNDNRLARRCIEFLSEKREKPFFLVAAFDNPHNLWEWACGTDLPWGNVAEPASPEECPDLPANHAVPPFEPRIVRAFQQDHEGRRMVLDFSEEEWRRLGWAYYRLVEKVDAQIGRILDALRENGLEENTLVIFSSDHGEHLGAHGLWQKSVPYQEAIRIPLILRWKGVIDPGRVDTTHLVSNGLDFYRTVCDYAKVEPPGGLDGLSLRALLEGRGDVPWRDHLVVETLFPMSQTRYAGRVIRSDRYKYIVYEWGCGRIREQLFDMREDPGEMVNLAVETRHRNELQRHRDLLDKWCGHTGDDFGWHYEHPERKYIVPGTDFGEELE